ncbi:unnamed protein product [Pleuronectes platessa]|uniref:Uncharacterized protein n=1 Tax=Pleuronectes platessa TaxID=8262 RepID=A0A9N7YVC4_PLEPL|nr:unnamed protein product [Pleuronectes platessa]
MKPPELRFPDEVNDLLSLDLSQRASHADSRLSSALPFLKHSLIWAQAFFTPAAACREREGVKTMSGGRRLALIINHLVPLSPPPAASSRLLEPRLLPPPIRSGQRGSGSPRSQRASK